MLVHTVASVLMDARMHLVASSRIVSLSPFFLRFMCLMCQILNMQTWAPVLKSSSQHYVSCKLISLNMQYSLEVWDFDLPWQSMLIITVPTPYDWFQHESGWDHMPGRSVWPSPPATVHFRANSFRLCPNNYGFTGFMLMKWDSQSINR